MYKRKSMRLRRFLAMIMTILIISGQLQSVAYAKGINIASDLQQENVEVDQNQNDSSGTQIEQGQEDNTEQGSSLEDKDTSNVDSTEEQKNPGEDTKEQEVSKKPELTQEQPSDKTVQAPVEKSQEKKEETEQTKSKSKKDEAGKKKEELELNITKQTENKDQNSKDKYNELKNSITDSSAGFGKGLGTAKNFGIFVNGLFSTSSQNSTNFAVRKFYSNNTPQIQSNDDDTSKVKQTIYIQNFSDAVGNIIKNNPLPVDYDLQVPAIVLGNGYQIDASMENGQAYGIDDKKLGLKSNIEYLLQDIDGNQFVDFDNEFTYLHSLSSYLASLATTKTASVMTNGSNLELTSNSNQYDVFNLSSIDFLSDKNVNTNINLQISSNATCIINVDLTDNTELDWTNQIFINGQNGDFLSGSGKVLWNFYTTEINVNGQMIYKPFEGKLATKSSVFGTFLVPGARVEIDSGNFNGSIVAKDLISNNSKINKVSFTGLIPEDASKKSDTNSQETKLNLNKTATYTGDFKSDDNTGKRTYRVDLSASAKPVVNETIEQTPNDIVLVLDRSGSMSENGEKGVTRLENLKEAAKSFVNSIKTGSPESNIEIISYSSDDNAKEVSNDTAGFLNVVTRYDSIVGAIDSLAAQGATRTDLAMKSAYDSLNQADIRNNGRPKTVVLFTDGVPTMWDTFDDGVANDANSYASMIKSEFAGTIFTIGLLSTLNDNEKAKAETFLTQVASYKKDSSEKRFYQTTDNLSLEDIFVKVSSEITGEITGASVKDYVNEYFVLTDDCKAKLDKLDQVSYGYDKNNKKWYVEWMDQTIPTEGNWSASIEIEAKNEFIGGNDIATNASASGIYTGNTLLAKFPQPKVNVPVKFSVGNEETTIRKGELIPTELYDNKTKKNEYVQTLMFNEHAVPDIFLEKEETGTFTYEWYWGNKLVGKGKSLESLVDGVIIDKETVLTLKVTFEPFHSDTNTDGRKGLAKSTPHTGTYTIHLICPTEKNLWINKCATYTGDFNSQDNTGKRTYLVKLVSNTLQVSKTNDVVIVMDRSLRTNAYYSLPKNYVYTKAEKCKPGEYYVIKKNDKYLHIRIRQDADQKLYYENWKSETSKLEKVFIDDIQLYKVPAKDDYTSQLQQVKEDAVNLVKSLKESSPESNICIISYASDTGVSNDTNGFLNVSNNVDSIIDAINGITVGGKSTPHMGLKEAYQVLNQNDVKYNGKTKSLVLYSADLPRSVSGEIDYNAGQEALHYADLIKNNLHADLYTVKLKNTLPKSEETVLENSLIEAASDISSNGSTKTYFNYTNDDVFTSIYNEVSDGIAGATVIDYIDERFQFTEETKKIFDQDINISYGFDKSRNQWYVKYNRQIIPTNHSVWFEQFEIEAKDEFIGGNCIPTNGDDSGVYTENKKIKDFPRPNVNVPVKFQVGNQETTIFYGEDVPQKLFDANTLQYKDVQTLMFDEKSIPDIFLGKGATGTFKYEWYLGENLVGEGKDLNSLVKDVVLDNDQLYTLKVTFMPTNQDNPPDKGKGLATNTSHTGTYLVHVVKGALTIQKTIDHQYTDIDVINANQSFVFEIKRYAVNNDGSKGNYIESYYETIDFAANEGVTSKNKTIVGLKKGYYEVIEDTDWSWKYNLISVSDNDIYSNAGDGIVYIGNKNKNISTTNQYFGEMNEKCALAKVEFINQIKDTNWLGDVALAINKFINKSR
ncbi:collagen-binding domain-containing protein [Anaerosacchariphilus polymeriproducens]|uniref:VWA domain-containing protein n=1 Tax=Anaerosacchariphilus polymeriproducens TaxID=1812858 RepID=A0A371B035_9FIRM|nr:collagen-binding domain-containing protein [Anaerosacchariphilus polymeriproducens]RDU25166.1 VWA domain-containing protein [Anaerosacchariphilus polymeriproducens]